MIGTFFILIILCISISTPTPTPFDSSIVFFDQDPNRGNDFDRYYDSQWGETSRLNLQRAMESINTGRTYQTDYLARFLNSQHEGSPMLNQIGIDFRVDIKNPNANYNEEMSRITRFVRESHPDWFYVGGPGKTRITPRLIDNIFMMKENLPNNFH